MSNLVITVLASIPLYLLPGYLVLRLFRMERPNIWDNFFYSLCISLVIVPTSFIAIGNVFHFIPNLTSILILIIFLFLLGLVLNKTNRRPLIQVPDTNRASAWEKFFVWFFLFLFTAFANLSRIAMFVQGTQVLDVGTFDETWHLDQLVSVARTGIPPAHYLFPTIKLVYYYASWIYPAIIGNLPILQISLARAMAIHSYIQIFAFLGLIYYLLLFNYRDWWIRLIGVSFFTVMSGFGLYAAAPNTTMAQWWQSAVGWLSSDMQIHPFSFAYAWVPQHIAGGMSFLLAVIVWKNTITTPLIKSTITGLLLAFCFTTSVFVFLALGLVIAIITILCYKTLLANWKKSSGYFLEIGIIFFLVTWLPLYTFSNRGGGFIWRSFQITAIELVRGRSTWSVQADRVLTILGIPFIIIWICIITFGLSFILYLLWLWKRSTTGKETEPSIERGLLTIFPPLCLFIVFFVTDQAGGGNFSMRSLIPAQILICFAALSFLEEVRAWLVENTRRRGFLIYLFVCFFVAESLTTYALLRWNFESPIKSVLALDFGPHNVPDWGSGVGTRWAMPGELLYIQWLNQNTPNDALVIEDGCWSINKDDMRYRWLERNRFMDPTCVSKLRWFPRDQDFILSTEWKSLLNQSKKYSHTLDFYKAIQLPNNNQPVYYVDRHGYSEVSWGTPVYSDDFVSIYRIK
jgi:hypothetical protein